MGECTLNGRWESRLARAGISPLPVQTAADTNQSSLTPACGCHFTGHDADPETQASREELNRRVHWHFRSRGGQLNPAVSVACGVVSRLPWRKVPVYVAGQYLGSFCACCLVYLVYFEAMENFDGGSRQVLGPNGTAAIWATYPQPFASVWTGLGDQVFSTGLLLLCMMAMSDPRNMMPNKGLYPIANGLLVIGLGLSFRLNCGNAMNPARDLAPRLFSVVAGWGLGPLSLRNYNWFWVNMLGPHVGAVVGALVYQGCVGLHWPQGSDNDEKLVADSSEPQPLSEFVKDDEAPVVTDDGQWQHGSQPRI